jgi:hypothetical protein
MARPISASTARGKLALPGWTVACALAEAIGMTAAAAAARTADVLHQAGVDRVAGLAVVVAGGLVEGAALGALQSRVLGPALGARVARRWLLVTAAVAGVGWALASAPSALSGAGDGTAPPLPLVLAAAGVLGAVMGLALGAAQSTVLRGNVTRPWRWPSRSAAAWAPAMVVIFLGATLPSPQWPTAVVVPLGTLTGLLAGVTLGVVSGPLLSTLDGPPVHNAMVLRLLGSRAHRMLDRSLVGLRVVGTVTGVVRELPVQYAADGDGIVVLPGHPDGKKWWRNLRGGAEVTVLLGGRWSAGYGVVLSPGDAGYAAAAETYRRRWPRARLPEGQPLVRIGQSATGGRPGVTRAGLTRAGGTGAR